MNDKIEMVKNEWYWFYDGSVKVPVLEQFAEMDMHTFNKPLYRTKSNVPFIHSEVLRADLPKILAKEYDHKKKAPINGEWYWFYNDSIKMPVLDKFDYVENIFEREVLRTKVSGLAFTYFEPFVGDLPDSLKGNDY